MKFVPTLLALALAGLATAASASTSPRVFNIGPLTTTPYINTAVVTAGTVFTLPSSGTLQFNFTDRYNFSVGNNILGSTAVNVDLDVGPFGFHISNLRLDLFNAGNSWLAGDIVSGPLDNTVNINQLVTAGNYYFLVRGFADGALTNQGIYTFTAAVPEAETYAMLLAGLGLVGYMVQRRRRMM